MTRQFWPRAATLALLPAFAGSLSAQDSTTTTLICLAPARVEASSGNANEALSAVRETFTAFLTGPSLRAQPLQARLESQVKEESKQAGCPYLLLTTIKVDHKRGGGGLLGRAAAGAVQQGAWEAGVRSGSTAGRIAGQAASGAASQAASNYAVTIRNKDELTLGYRLETPDGKVLVEKREKRKATQDGQDLLTPLVQEAAERIVAAAKEPAR
ncbi:MAG TPA: hypothetical protein VFO95_16730 [Gemmatimonadales bacterium]|nr:hypothetical protein [Gemmatimonadales bacterium]